MITLSELKMKEVILIKNGQRLGFIDDLIIDIEKGFIRSIVILERDMKGMFLKKSSERLIEWNQIVTIGQDTILVDDDTPFIEKIDEAQAEEREATEQ